MPFPSAAHDISPMQLRHTLPALLISLAWAASPTVAQAAGMNCARAATATEKAICADPELLERDARLADTYSRMLAADASKSAAVRDAQRAWLQVRNRCGANASCLRNAYDERTATLIDQHRLAAAYQPDDTDLQAAEELKTAIAEQLKKNPEFPLENALNAFRIPDADMTAFANEPVPNSDDPAEFPRKRPKGVNEDEWRALKATDLVSESENGSSRYALIDLDGDGKRDLIIDDYIGGTGLFNYISTRRRDGGKFVDGTSVYSLNGRGANQDGTWVRLQGRVYAAYRVGYYGEDTLYLMRALKPAGKVPAVTVHYRYNLQVPKVQVSDDGKTRTTLDDKLHSALTKALPKVTVAQDRQPSMPKREPICPIPANTSEDDRDAYYGAGPGHYTIEIVADFPVQKDGVCHIGRLIDWFGGYDNKEGLAAMYSVSRPGAAENDSKTYNVTGKRTATDVSTSLKAVEGNNGI
ncbi:lysozyme inhibitor LprI family protein [Pigmentiphaga aceris]|nr:lysozyme inhibitor LprI family protein [Pigmentiphaga aceris]